MFGGLRMGDRQLLETIVKQNQTILGNQKTLLENSIAVVQSQQTLLRAAMQELALLRKILTTVSSPKSPGPVASLQIQLGKAVPK